MPLPQAGNSISLNQVNVELGLTATAQISLDAAAVRSLFGRASGAISMSDGFGKSNVPPSFEATITTNQTGLNLRTWAVGAGWNQTLPAIITVAPSVIINSTSTATPALTIDGAWPGGVALVNNGIIYGRGGNGGSTIALPAVSPGGAGGNAISLGIPVTITNNNIIAGGGGGGGQANGGTGGLNPSGIGAGGGGGAGNGVGGTGNTSNFGGNGGATFPGTGGAGRAHNTGAGGGWQSVSGNAGGSGGGGSIQAGGVPFPPCGGGDNHFVVAAGGGGGWGAAGGIGRGSGGACGLPTGTSGAGGSGSAVGGAGTLVNAINPTSAPGGAGGRAVALNGNTATFPVTGTRFGAIS